MACWLDPDSFKYKIDFFGILELYSYSGNIYMVEEGYYQKGKRQGLFRVSSLEQNYLGWFDNDQKHGKFIEHNYQTNVT